MSFLALSDGSASRSDPLACSFCSLSLELEIFFASHLERDLFEDVPWPYKGTACAVQGAGPRIRPHVFNMPFIFVLFFNFLSICPLNPHRLFSVLIGL